MNEQRTWNIPDKITEECKRFFSPTLIQTGLRLFKLSRVSISFKKGSADTYYIVSGLVRDDRAHETKIVYKKRLEDTPEGPFSSNCDCHHWKESTHCGHVVSLFITYQVQQYLEEQGNSAEAESDSHLPPIVINSSFGVNVAEYGTIINGPHQLIGAPAAPTYSSLQYLLHNKKVVAFPMPETFRGKLQVYLYHEEKVRFKYLPLETDKPVNEVSLFENLYLFNWKDGAVFHIPSDLKILVQRIRLNLFSYTINDVLTNIQELGLFHQVDIFIENVSIDNLKSSRPKSRVTLAPAEKKGLLHASIEFFDESELLVMPNDFLAYFTFNYGILSHFKKKQEAYDFVVAVKDSLVNNNDGYKKFVVSSSKKVKIQSLLTEIQKERDTILYDQSNKILCIYDNQMIKALFLSMIQHFGDQFFRYAHLDQDERKIKYDVQPSVVFQGLTEFHRAVSMLGVEIYYDRHEISKWNSRIRFERRSSSTKWFDLELNIDEQDLAVIQEADLEAGMVITKKGLILLSKEQKDLIRFMQKYTKYEAVETKTEIDGSQTFKKFLLPFNRARIFELFELRKLGIDGALSEEDLALCEKLSNLTEMPAYDLPTQLNGILRPYQVVGYNWLRFLYEHKLGACLADDMGLGKTLQTITFLQSIYDKLERVLIVCPVTILLNWEKEIQKFSQMDMHIYHGGSREFPHDKKIILTSYGVMKKESEAVFANINFDILILDEVQHLKNVRSLGAFSARKINADFRVCLTGTPVENDLSEFYNILDLSIPGIWGDLQFVRATSNAKTRGIARRTASPFILRRTKAQVLHDLPPKIENNVYLELSEEENKFYQQNIVSIRARINNSTTSAKYGEILRGLLQLRQNCLWQNRTGDSSYKNMDSTKIEFLMETLETILEEGQQAIIFSQFTTYLDIIQHYFREKHWKFSRIDGSQSINKRQEQVDQFQSGKTPIFLISLKAGGVGLNLTAASYVFIMDPWWNPAVESQAIDRAHRIGQKNTLTVYRPIIKNSVEEKVLKLQEEKKQLFQDLLSSDEDDSVFSGRLTMKDFEMLFS
ncbi:MAG: DEAD/DEAH box helicase [Bdellovibrionales bacterium]|nr:DEAD/DEAH box helicase [Bdellovibrionales bacterium]